MSNNKADDRILRCFLCDKPQVAARLHVAHANFRVGDVIVEFHGVEYILRGYFGYLK